MDIEQFVRLYPQRAPQIMWFLGAGASAAAGVPTAGQMIWDFKRQIYCATQRVMEDRRTVVATSSKTVGDTLCAAFADAADAVAGQRGLTAESRAETAPLGARIPFYTGATGLWGGDYFRQPLDGADRFLAAMHGRQILLSQPTADLAGGHGRPASASAISASTASRASRGPSGSASS